MRTPASGSLARSRLIWTSMAFEPSGSVSSAHACSAIALRSTTAGDAAHQELEDPVLGAGQREVAPGRLHRARDGVEAQLAGAQHGRVHAAGPSLQRAHAGEQLAEVERLDEVVVGARVEALDPVRRRVAGGEHQQGGRTVVLAGPG